MNKKNIVERTSRLYTVIGFVCLFFAIILILIPVTPYLWYSINPDATEQELDHISKNIIEHGSTLSTSTVADQLPPINPDLPKEAFLVIEKVGIYSPIETKENYIEILKKGTWLVPEYGNPMESGKSIILAAHRFGYAYWDSETRKKVSFFNLPKTEVGDEIKIIWEQREFTYEIYSKEESTFISDYDADLILYTCKYFNSPVRIFRYARATF